MYRIIVFSKFPTLIRLRKTKKVSIEMISLSEEGSNKILVAISLDHDESQNVLSWAINVLAKPNDTIVALHLLG